MKITRITLNLYRSLLMLVCFSFFRFDMQRKKCYTIQEAAAIIQCLSDEEEEVELVVLPPENEVVTDEEIDDIDATDIQEVAGEIEIHTRTALTDTEDVPPCKRRKPNKREWKKDKFQVPVSPDGDSLNPVQSNDSCELSPLKEEYPLLKNMEPIEVFNLFFDESIIQLITVETKRYADQKGEHTFNVSESEIKAFLGILLLSGYHSLPREKLYWCNDEDVGVPLVQSKMSRNRFQTIKRFLHLSDNLNLEKNDRLRKIRSYLNMCKAALCQFGVFSKHLAIDEQMVPYFGKNSLKQYIRGKPVKFGMKLWVLASSDGFPFDFEVYTGKEGIAQKGLVGERVVMNFAEKIPNKRHHCLYTDNFFTSANLLSMTSSLELRHTGTVRQNRIDGCPMTDNKEYKKTPRGSYEMYGDGELTAVQWNDSKPVIVISNFEGVEPTKSVRRWNKAQKSFVDIQIPAMIASYNSFMGGVDLLDRFMSDYRPTLRNRKWWWCLFSNQLNMAVVAAWRLHVHLDGKMDHLQFRREIVRSLLLKIPSKKYITGPSRNPVATIRYSSPQQHLPQPANRQGRCKQCYKNTTYFCQQCDVLLHSRCFAEYHRAS